MDPVRDITIINNELRVKVTPPPHSVCSIMYAPPLTSICRSQDLEAAKKALEPLVKSVARGLKSAKPEHVCPFFLKWLSV